MAYSKKTSNNEWKNVNGMDGFTVIGSKERFSISFEVTDSLRIGVNGCRVVDGKNGEFISFPAWRGKDGKYHDYCYYTFTDEETKMIISTLA